MSDLSLLDQDNGGSTGTQEFWKTNSYNYLYLFEIARGLSDEDRANCGEILETMMERFSPNSDYHFTELYSRYCVITAVELAQLDLEEYRQFGSGRTYGEYVREREECEATYYERLQYLVSHKLAGEEDIEELKRMGNASFWVDHNRSASSSRTPKIVYELWYLYGTLTPRTYIRFLNEGFRGLYNLAMAELSIVSRDLQINPGNEYLCNLYDRCLWRVWHIVYDMSFEERVVRY